MKMNWWRAALLLTAAFPLCSLLFAAAMAPLYGSDEPPEDEHLDDDET